MEYCVSLLDRSNMQFEGKTCPLLPSCWPPSGKHITVSSGTVPPQLQSTHPPDWMTAPLWHPIGMSQTELHPSQPCLLTCSCSTCSLLKTRAKTLTLIFDASFFHPTSNPSIHPVGLTLKYIENAITSDHLHCHHLVTWVIAMADRLPCFLPPLAPPQSIFNKVARMIV